MTRWVFLGTVIYITLAFSNIRFGWTENGFLIAAWAGGFTLITAEIITKTAALIRRRHERKTISRGQQYRR